MSQRLERQQRIRQAIIAGLVFAREHFHEAKDVDVAIAIEVELQKAGVRLSTKGDPRHE